MKKVLVPQVATISTGFEPFGRVAALWELSKIMALHIDPKQQGSYSKDIHKTDPQFIEAAILELYSYIRFLYGRSGLHVRLI